MPTKVKGTTGVDKVEAGAVITNPEFSGNATVTGTLTVNSTASINGSNISTQPSFRNLIINGDMQIAQRGTSVAGITSSGYYTVDRFKCGVGSLGTWTMSQDSDVPTGQGFANSVKLQCTSTGSAGTANALNLQHPLEGQMLQQLKKGTANAESLTVSFWVKSNKTGTYICELYDFDNTRQVSTAYTIDNADTWEKKIFTVAGDTTGAFDNNNALSLSLIHWLGAGSDYQSGTLNTSWASSVTANRIVGQVNLADSTSNYINITGVQLEVGTNASDFEFLPVDVQLARCQRYYYLHCEGNQRGVANGAMYTASVAYANIKFPVNMRADPSLEVTSGNNFRAFAGNGLSTATSVGIWSQHGTTNEFISLSGLARTQGQACFIDTNDAACKLAFSAEL